MALNERNPDIKPDWHYVRRDETEYWGDCDAKRLGGKLIATYAFDKNSVTYCCSLTPAYWMVYLGTHAEPSRELTEDEWEQVHNDITESDTQECSGYFNCGDVDYHMNAQPLSFNPAEGVDRDYYSDDEQGDADYTRACEEYIREAWGANPW